ncbi:hypothetical protein CPLU01_14331 [Colletotrichum plurivorum]|uniref:Uncharacterized protein n=2 Tax=Colletotrichum orchidearum species complex TaxID=2707337 RepID=A0A8H6JKU0_9PEZI|nr:hypothetical protein CPLU01_14331 [Colletotrichum plurivorum]KAF6815973.1 hypothetical protein CSOJ01_03242 [Colletotrichum sojae]
MSSFDPSTTSTFWRPIALPVFTGLLAVLGATDGLVNLSSPESGAATFGLVPPRRASVMPAQFDAFHHALVKVKGARNLHMSSCVIAMLLYGRFSDACRASPEAAAAVRRCVGILLTLGAGVGFSGAVVISEYLSSPGVSNEAIEVGRSKTKAHLLTSVPIVALGLVYLIY